MDQSITTVFQLQYLAGHPQGSPRPSLRLPHFCFDLPCTPHWDRTPNSPPLIGTFSEWEDEWEDSGFSYSTDFSTITWVRANFDFFLITTQIPPVKKAVWAVSPDLRDSTKSEETPLTHSSSAFPPRKRRNYCTGEISSRYLRQERRWRGEKGEKSTGHSMMFDQWSGNTANVLFFLFCKNYSGNCLSEFKDATK